METIVFTLFKRSNTARFNEKKQYWEYPPQAKGEESEIPYTEFVKLLTHSEKGEYKGYHSSVIFGKLKDKNKARGRDNIEYRNCITIEIDGLFEQDRQRLKEGLQRMKTECIGYSSFNHLADGKTMKMHLVFPLSENIYSQEHYTSAFHFLQNKLLENTNLVLNECKISPLEVGEINLDNSAHSWSLVMYLPCVRRNMPFHHLYIQGKKFNPKKIDTKGLKRQSDVINNNNNVNNLQENCNNLHSDCNNQKMNCNNTKEDCNNRKTDEAKEWKTPYKILKNQHEKTSKENIRASVIIEKFNNYYTWEQVLSYFLQDVYIKSGEKRYRYYKSSSTAGMVLINNDLCCSFHTLDPANDRKACNKFQLLCIHKFNNDWKACVDWIKNNNLIVLQ
ncbi:MAG: hypothetical protein IJ681_02685 [Bacteroidales bacterium]|nr:hypothetical protein [Bacteroidales bacterium]